MANRSSGSPTVETTDGKLRGWTNGTVNIFKGIRYGEATDGAHRFLPPRPVKPWAGVRDALALGAAAPQHPVPANTEPFFSWYAAVTDVSEDCLFLNVFAPAREGSGRPVIFWIHGGGWREYSGGAPGFDGSNLAVAQDVVVVTINHRLNAFGYIQLSDTDERFKDSGNAGLLDIVAALKWVRDNISAFGGNPGNITIFGESGGAAKVAALMSMPAAEGLFQKAVISSTGDGMHLVTPEEAAANTAELARALGLPRLTGEDLQKVPMDTLIMAVKATGRQFRGIIDDRTIFRHPFGDSAPTYAVNVPVLAGCTNHETYYYLYWDAKNFSLDWSGVNRRLARYFRFGSDQAESLIRHYRARYPDEDPTGIMVLITSDFIFKRNTYRVAALQAASANVPVYTYLFAHEPLKGDRRMRAAHTVELPFIFGTTKEARATVGDGPDVAPMTQIMQSAWGNFARTGNPNTSTLPEWKPYTKQDRQTMVLGLNSRMSDNPGGEARAALDTLPFFSFAYTNSDFFQN